MKYPRKPACRVTVRRESVAKAILKKTKLAKAKHGVAKASRKGPRKQVHRTAFLHNSIWHGSGEAKASAAAPLARSWAPTGASPAPAWRNISFFLHVVSGPEKIEKISKKGFPISVPVAEMNMLSMFLSMVFKGIDFAAGNMFLIFLRGGKQMEAVEPRGPLPAC